MLTSKPSQCPVCGPSGHPLCPSVACLEGHLPRGSEHLCWVASSSPGGRGLGVDPGAQVPLLEQTPPSRAGAGVLSLVGHPLSLLGAPGAACVMQVTAQSPVWAGTSPGRGATTPSSLTPSAGDTRPGAACALPFATLKSQAKCPLPPARCHPRLCSEAQPLGSAGTSDLPSPPLPSAARSSCPALPAPAARGPGSGRRSQGPFPPRAGL